MGTKKILKITCFNMMIAVINIILFSPGLLSIQIGGTSTFETSFGATAILMSLVVFIFGNFKLLTEKEKIIQTNDIKTKEDYINALKLTYSKKTFENDINTLLEQIERFNNKKKTIKDILLQKFNDTEMSFSKFNTTISDIEDVFYLNIKSILNKLNAFDEKDYDRIKKNSAKKKFNTEFLQTKMSIYNEYISFIKDSADDNEQILLKLDKILLEISKLNSLEDGELENMTAMKEIDELINKIKLYR